MASLTQVRVAHVFREANKCAYYLAKNGCHMREDFVIFDIFPSNELDGLLVFDRNGQYSYRRVASTLAFVASLYLLLLFNIMPINQKEKRKAHS